MEPTKIIEKPEDVRDREDFIGEREHLSDMEKEIYVDNLIIEYQGYFSYKELLTLVDNWCRERGYYKEVMKSKHWITPSGKNSSIAFRLHKKFKQLYVSVIDVKVTGMSMVDEVKELGGKLVGLNKGKAKIVFDAWLMSHMKYRWETRPKFAVIRRIIDKFVYKLERYEFPGKVVNDAKDLANKLRGDLLIYKHRLGPGEVKEVEEKPPEEAKEEKLEMPPQRTGAPVK